MLASRLTDAKGKVSIGEQASRVARARAPPYLWEYLFLMAFSLSSGGAASAAWSFRTTGAKSDF